MSEIPTDVMRTAHDAWNAAWEMYFGAKPTRGDAVYLPIARAILAERERGAKIANEAGDAEHPRRPNETRDEIELFLRDAFAAGCRAARERSLFVAMEYAAREAPKLRSVLAQQWKLIATAPKDGSRILAFARGKYGPKDVYYGVAQWVNADPDVNPGIPLEELSLWDWPFAIRPTHWTEVPEPPAIEEEQE